MGGEHLFKPGNTVGKFARPKNITDMRAMAKEYTAEMLRTLVEIALDRDERGQVRVAAADLVLTRAYGKAESYSPTEQGNQGRVEELSTQELTMILNAAKTNAQASIEADTNGQLLIEQQTDKAELSINEDIETKS